MNNDIKLINEYGQISDLIMASLKKGVRTNTAMSREEYEREIKNSSLMAGETPQGLIILRNRPSHVKMNYYINDTGCALDMAEIVDAIRNAGWYGADNNENEDKADSPSLDKPIAVETAFRERDAALRETVEYLAGCGFEEVLSRVRLSREADVVGNAGDENDGTENSDTESAEVKIDEMDIYVRKSFAEDAAAVQPLLYGSFDPVTGCLPEEDELLTDLAAGNILLLFADDDSCAASAVQDEAFTGAAVPLDHADSRLSAAVAAPTPAASRLPAARPAPPCGLLHYAAAKKSAEIKHLTISSDMRGCGLSAALINAFLSECEGKKASVWTGSDNIPALNAYKDCGFEEDGRRSSVMVYRV